MVGNLTPDQQPTLFQQPTVLIYRWGNNPARAKLKGRPCAVIATGAMNSIMIEMTDTQERVITSRWAVK